MCLLRCGHLRPACCTVIIVVHHSIHYFPIILYFIFDIFKYKSINNVHNTVSDIRLYAITEQNYELSNYFHGLEIVTKDYSAIAGVRSPLYLIFKYLFQYNNK